LKIVTCVFDYPDTAYDYKIFHAVLKESCRRHMPDVEFVTLHPDNVRKIPRHPTVHITNTLKLQVWGDYIRGADDDVILIDSDMICHAPGYHAFDKEFDIAYTMRTGRQGLRHIPERTINGGVVMVRNTPEAKSWIVQLRDINEQMFNDNLFHSKWQTRYPGMNQSAMGWMLEQSGHPARLHEYTTRDWNAVDCDWHVLKPETVFIHCKGRLRSAIIKGQGSGELLPLVDEWLRVYNSLYKDGRVYKERPVKMRDHGPRRRARR
jgi:hypothetical protein